MVWARSARVAPGEGADSGAAAEAGAWESVGSRAGDGTAVGGALAFLRNIEDELNGDRPPRASGGDALSNARGVGTSAPHAVLFSTTSPAALPSQDLGSRGTIGADGRGAGGHKSGDALLAEIMGIESVDRRAPAVTHSAASSSASVSPQRASATGAATLVFASGVGPVTTVGAGGKLGIGRTNAAAARFPPTENVDDGGTGGPNAGPGAGAGAGPCGGPNYWDEPMLAAAGLASPPTLEGTFAGRVFADDDAGGGSDGFGVGGAEAGSSGGAGAAPCGGEAGGRGGGDTRVKGVSSGALHVAGLVDGLLRSSSSSASLSSSASSASSSVSGGGGGGGNGGSLVLRFPNAPNVAAADANRIAGELAWGLVVAGALPWVSIESTHDR